MTFLEEIAQRIDKALDGDCGYGVGKHLAEQLSPLIAAHDAALVEKLALSGLFGTSAQTRLLDEARKIREGMK